VGTLRLLRSGLHFYLAGLIVLTLGIALTIESALGASPFDAVLVGLYRTFGLSIGSWEVVVGLTMILGNAFAERKRPEFIALLTSIVTGIGIDMWLFLLSPFTPSSFIGEYLYLIFGVIFIALGVSTYLQSTIAPNPMDRSMMVLSKLTGWSVSYSRALISIVLVIVAYFFNGDIGIGTLINAVASGFIISFFLPYLQRLKNSMQPN